MNFLCSFLLITEKIDLQLLYVSVYGRLVHGLNMDSISCKTV